jgi:two-component system, OmpR family, alkaline phosphatase synthesis response regulator PhoP
VEIAADGKSALEAFRRAMPAAVVLDLRLPALSGRDVCRAIKEQTPWLPIIVLSATSDVSDKVLLLELGADDYVTKPFSPRVLTARVKAVLRRDQAENGDGQATIKISDLVIHPGRHQVLVADRPVDLTASEFRILLFMARKPGWVFTRQQIVDAAQGDDVYVNERFVTDRSVDVHIVSLRRKLGACGGYIDTVRGVGYRLKDE